MTQETIHRPILQTGGTLVPRMFLSSPAQTARDAVGAWLSQKIRTDIPVVQNGLSEFSNEHGTIEIIHVQMNEADIWSARYRQPCAQTEGRIWNTEILIWSHNGDLPQCGLRLSVIDPYTYRDIDFSPPLSTPNVLRDLNKTFLLQNNDQFFFSDAPYVLSSLGSLDLKADINKLIALLEDPQRRAPIFIATARRNTADTINDALINTHFLAKRTFGLGYVFFLDKDATRLLSQKIGTNLSVYDGAIRTYMPRFNRSLSAREGYIQHPVASNKALQQWSRGAKGFTDFLIATAYRLSTQHADNANQFPPFNDLVKYTLRHSSLKQTEIEDAEDLDNAAAQAPIAEDMIHAQSVEDDTDTPQSAHARPSSEDQAALIRALEQDNLQLTGEKASLTEELARVNRLNGVLREETDIALSMAANVERIAQELRTNEEELRIQLEELEQRTPQSAAVHTKNSSLFPDVSLIGEWAKEHLSGRLVLTARALKAAKRSLYGRPEHLYQALQALGLQYRDGILYSSVDDRLRTAYQNRVCQLGMNDAHSDNLVLRRYKDIYTTTTDDGRSHTLNRHLGKGNARDRRHCLRVYYTWDDQDKVVVVGHLPDHLKNSLT